MMNNTDTTGIIGRAIEPIFEGLEVRRLMSGSIAMDAGVVEITGTNKRDRLRIIDAGSDIVVRLNDVRKSFAKVDVEKFYVRLGAGSDTVLADPTLSKPMEVYGEGGNDRVVTGSGSDTVVGGQGADRIWLNGGSDKGYGGPARDSIEGGLGNDTLVGNAGDDTLAGGVGADIVRTGAGSNTVFVNPSAFLDQSDAVRNRVTVSSTGQSQGNTAAPAAPRILSLALVDASTGRAIPGYERLTGSAVLNLLSTDLPGSINVVATASSDTGSTRFLLNAGQLTRVDDTTDYTLSDTGLRTAAGVYSISVTPFERDGAAGVSGPETTLRLNITTPVVVDDDDDTTIDDSTNNNNNNNTDTNPVAGGPVARFDVALSNLRAGQAVHVDATDTTIPSADLEDASFSWDFGDAGSEHNKLAGFNAAHVYERPGTYTVRLTVTSDAGLSHTISKQVTIAAASQRDIYVGGAGASDSNDGSSPSRALKTAAEAFSRLSDNTRVLFATGETYEVSRALQIAQDNVTITSTGNGTKPLLLWTGPKTSQTILSIGRGSQHVRIENLSFDTQNSGGPNKAGQATAISPAGSDIIIRNNTFLNLMNGVNANGKPTRLMVVGNEAPLDTGIRAYFVWSEGVDHVIVGNSAANSTREHILRVGGTERILIQRNQFSNTDRTDRGDAIDYAKGAINNQRGAFSYIADNTIRGPWGAGPLGADGADRADRFQHVRVEHNDANDSFLMEHGLEHVTFINNRINTETEAPAIEIDGYDNGFRRGVVDVVISGNLVTNNSSRGRFLSVRGQVDGISLLNNTLVAPSFRPGSYGTAAVYVEQNSLSSFRRIDGNLWPATSRGSASIDGGMMYIGTGNSTSGYQNAGEWNNQSVVGSDRFEDVSPLSINRSAGVRRAA
jgi:hypothetical protein